MREDSVRCRCCEKRCSEFLWEGVLIGETVSYYDCHECGYLQTEDPYWLDRAYSSAINDSDTGIVARNNINTRYVLVTLLLLRQLEVGVVDFAGGYGLLVRMLRDKGIDAFWRDQYCDNLVARGFEHSGQKAGLVTAFEAFEHFVNPKIEFEKLVSLAPNVLFSTELIGDVAPPHGTWWYYGEEHGQHIGFFRNKTLVNLAKLNGMHYVSFGQNYHLISQKPVNEFLWRFLMRYARYAAPLIAKTLTSKTWTDHKKRATQSCG